LSARENHAAAFDALAALPAGTACDYFDLTGSIPASRPS